MEVWIYTIISVILVSAISLIGIFTLFFNKNIPKKILLFLVSFAVGGLFGDAFIHLLPESFEKLGTNLTTSLYIVLGILIFFVLEKFIRWRHCHIAAPEGHPHPVVVMNLIGDGVHNLVDGMLIGASYTVSIPIGISTTLAIILHEIPQEIGDFASSFRFFSEKGRCVQFPLSHDFHFRGNNFLVRRITYRGLFINFAAYHCWRFYIYCWI